MTKASNFVSRANFSSLLSENGHDADLSPVAGKNQLFYAMFISVDMKSTWWSGQIADRVDGHIMEDCNMELEGFVTYLVLLSTVVGWISLLARHKLARILPAGISDILMTSCLACQGTTTVFAALCDSDCSMLSGMSLTLLLLAVLFTLSHEVKWETSTNLES